MRNAVLLIAIVASHLLYFTYGQEDYTSWTCTTAGNCVRYGNSGNLINSTVYTSLDVCRLVCGAYGSLWPIPTGFTSLVKHIVNFNPNSIRFHFENTVLETEKFLNAVSKIFIDNLLMKCLSDTCDFTSDTEVTVNIRIQDQQLNLTHSTDESYSIRISTVGGNNENGFIEAAIVTVQINATTIFGARHALETLSQLIALFPSSEDPGYCHANSINCQLRAVIMASAKIQDYPIFKHRGLLLDTARNFIPVEDIKRTLDGMGASKLNVFHWHATDSHSFPLHLPRVPELVRYGAYSPNHVYSYDVIQDIVSYARLRGIRVIIEIDAPSHAGNGWQWGPDYGYGELALCINKQPWRTYCIQPPCGQLNPANLNIYTVLKNIYKDIANLLPIGEFMHMGGDEVRFPCWNSTAEILEYMNSKGLGRETNDFIELWGEFQQKSAEVWDEVVDSAVNARNTSEKNLIILWSSQLTNPEHIEKYLPTDRYIIQTWVPSNDTLPKQLLSQGYNIIFSTKNAWYFDHGFWGATQYYPWATVYKNRIPQEPGVLGGEACLWSEIIDENSLDNRIWPRAAALAERLWADPNITPTLAQNRMYRHRDRLVARGLNADPVAPKWCIQNEGACV